MTQIRTPLGTNSEKASNTSLSINNVTCAVDSQLVVAVAYDNSKGQPLIKFGEKVLSLIDKQENDGTGFTVGMWTGRNINQATERDIIATWPGEIEARAMFAVQLTEAGDEDVFTTNQQDQRDDPTTGPNTPTTVADTIHIHAFMGNGPETDTQGVASAGDTLGQRDGTIGGTDTSNVFIQETHEVQTTLGNMRGRIANATVRDWAAVGVAFVEA